MAVAQHALTPRSKGQGHAVMSASEVCCCGCLCCCGTAHHM